MFNPTQLLGLSVTAISAIWLAITWLRIPSRFWLACLFFFLLLHLEIWYGGRHQLHGLVVGWLKQLGWYSQRESPQIVLSLLFSLAITVLGCSLLIWSQQLRKHIGASLSIGLLVAIFGLEAISLHAIDAILYQKFASILLVGWLWAAACVPLWWNLILRPRTTDFKD